MRIKRQFISNILGVVVVIWCFTQSVHILGWLVGYKRIGNSFVLTSSLWVYMLAMLSFVFDTIIGFVMLIGQTLGDFPDWDKIMRSILEHVIDFDVTPEKKHKEPTQGDV